MLEAVNWPTLDLDSPLPVLAKLETWKIILQLLKLQFQKAFKMLPQKSKMLQLNHVNFNMDTHHHHSMYFLTILGSTSKYVEVFPTGNVICNFAGRKKIGNWIVNFWRLMIEWNVVSNPRNTCALTHPIKIYACQNHIQNLNCLSLRAWMWWKLVLILLTS